jgi:hypothetical protein
VEKIASQNCSSQNLEALICEFGACGGVGSPFTAGTATAPLDLCAEYPAVCTIGIDLASILKSIPVVAATVATMSMVGDNGGCVPPAGTQCYETHSGHPHNGWDPHSHIWTQNRNPSTGQCFWNRGAGTGGAVQTPPAGMNSCSAYPTWPAN